MLLRFNVFLCIFLGFTFCFVHGQSPDSHVKKRYVTPEGDIYFPLSEFDSIYLNVATTGGNNPILLNLSGNKQSPLQSGRISLDLVRRNGFKVPKGAFSFFIDDIAPISKTIPSNTPKHIRNGVIYYGKGLSVTLNTNDPLLPKRGSGRSPLGSGILELYQALNTDSYSPYASTLTFTEEGVQNLNYYAVDRVGNVELVKQSNFTIDLTAPTSSYESIGITKGNIYSQNAQIKLTSSDQLSGLAQIEYRLNGGNYKKYSQYPITLTALKDGKHTLNYKAIDHVRNEETEQLYNFEVDRIPPLIQYEIIGDYFVRDKIYFAADTKIRLYGIDNRSGVDKIYFQLDKQEAQEYIDVLSFTDTTGSHTLHYYGIDFVKNSSKPRYTKVNFTYDTTPPSFNEKYKGPQFLSKDTLYIREYTKITPSITDKESGLQTVTFQLDSGNTQLFRGGLRVKNQGFHHIHFTCTDWVNNTSSHSTAIYVDRLPPEITTQFSTIVLAEKEVNGEIFKFVPANCKIFASALDKESGVEEIYYVINGGIKRNYSGAIDNFKKKQATVLEIYAADHLGNINREVIRLYIDE